MSTGAIIIKWQQEIISTVFGAPPFMSSSVSVEVEVPEMELMSRAGFVLDFARDFLIIQIEIYIEHAIYTG
jgi:hypothetical protein